MDQRSEEALRSEFEKIAPGTALREGVDYIISARTGALIVIGDVGNVAKLCNGGFDIDTPFTAQHLFELSKMDGAITMDAECGNLLRANVHLVPDPTLPTTETGMRHRTAERVSRQTKALVISISQRRDVVTLYVDGNKIILDDIEVVLAKANQALQTLQRYKTRLDEVLERLTALEFDDIVTLDDLSEAVSRFELVQRVAREVSRYISELGTEGRLVRMQAEELTANVDEDYVLLIRDYAHDTGPRKAASMRSAFGAMTTDQLLEVLQVGRVLNLPEDIASGEDHLRPRGFRILKRIPLIPASVINRLVEKFRALPDLLAASEDELDEVDGVGSRRARAIIDGLARMRSRLGT